MKKLLTLIAFICFYANAKAQYVNIPDSNFRYFLLGKYYTCFNANMQLDTTCSKILSDTILYLSNKKIKKLKGIEYFKSLKELNCSYNEIDTIFNLSNTIRRLYMTDNKLDSLPNFLMN